VANHHDLLEAYIIRRSAFWLKTSTHVDSFSWERAVRAQECFGVGVAVHMQRSCQANTKDLNYIQAWSRSSTRGTNLNIPNDDQHESAGGAKEISFFYARSPASLWSELVPNTAVRHR
jgi:hypothetical protein